MSQPHVERRQADRRQGRPLVDRRVNDRRASDRRAARREQTLAWLADHAFLIVVAVLVVAIWAQGYSGRRAARSAEIASCLRLSTRDASDINNLRDDIANLRGDQAVLVNAASANLAAGNARSFPGTPKFHNLRRAEGLADRVSSNNKDMSIDTKLNEIAVLDHQVDPIDISRLSLRADRIAARRSGFSCVGVTVPASVL